MKNRESVQKLVWGTGSLAALFGLWYVLSCTASFGRLMPSPVEVIQFIGQGLVTPIGRQALGQHILWSLSRVMVGYVAAAVCGILLGFCASWFKVGEAVIKPFYLLLRSIPSIAWIPLAILWLGIGERSKYFIIFITAVMIIMTNVMDGVKAVDPGAEPGYTLDSRINGTAVDLINKLLCVHYLVIAVQAVKQVRKPKDFICIGECFQIAGTGNYHFQGTRKR